MKKNILITGGYFDKKMMYSWEESLNRCSGAVKKADRVKMLAKNMVRNNIFEEDIIRQQQTNTQELTPTKQELENARIAVRAERE